MIDGAAAIDAAMNAADARSAVEAAGADAAAMESPAVDAGVERERDRRRDGDRREGHRKGRRRVEQERCGADERGGRANSTEFHVCFPLVSRATALIVRPASSQGLRRPRAEAGPINAGSGFAASPFGILR